MKFSSLELQKEVAWREKYQIDFAANLPEQYVLVKAAPLLTFNIWRKSDLGKILIGHGNRLEKKLFSGDTLSDDWLLKSFKNSLEYTDVIEAIGNAKPNFTRLLKSYRKIFRALILSDLSVNSEVTNASDETYIKTKAFFKWCKQNNIPIDKEVKEGYKVFLQPAPTITRHIFPSYKNLSSYDEVIRVAISEFETVNGYPPTDAKEIIGRLKSKPPQDCDISFDTDESVILKGVKREYQWLRSRINSLCGFTKSKSSELKPAKESAETSD